MPGPDEHTTQADSNSRFMRSASFENGAFRDWFVTAAFYTAVHWVDCYLAQQPYVARHPERHRYRWEALDELLALTVMPQDVYDAYSDLYTLSVKARYNCVPMTEARVRYVEDALLPPIRQWAYPTIGSPSPIAVQGDAPEPR